MLALNFETPSELIERLEGIVMQDWQASGRPFGETRDPITDAEIDGWCIVRSPSCCVSIAREPFMLWFNPLEIRMIEWPAERRSRPRVSVSRMIEMMPRAAEDLLKTAAIRMEIGSDPLETARQWLKPLDWRLAAIDPVIGSLAQQIIDNWKRSGSTENQVDRELFLAADRDVRHWTEHARAQSLLLRLMLTPGAALPPDIQTAARGTLEMMETITDEMLRASTLDLLFEPQFRHRYQEALRVWVGLLDACAHVIVIPGGRMPFPTAGDTMQTDFRFRFPERLLWLWIRRAREIGELVRRGSLIDHVDADLVSVNLEALDERRHEMIMGVVILAAVMLQYNQGGPDQQEEVAQIAEEILPCLDRPSLVGLHPSDRGPRVAKLRALAPNALRMGRELSRRGLNLALMNQRAIASLVTDRGTLHQSFPFKLGPEQPLPYAHLLTASNFEDIAKLFEA